MYFGWIVVFVGAIIMMLVMGTTVSVFGLYVLPVSSEFGLSRADVNSGFALMNLGGAVIAPLVGRAANDRGGVLRHVFRRQSPASADPPRNNTNRPSH